MHLLKVKQKCACSLAVLVSEPGGLKKFSKEYLEVSLVSQQVSSICKIRSSKIDQTKIPTQTNTEADSGDRKEGETGSQPGSELGPTASIDSYF